MARSVFADSNVIIDVASLNPVWMEWSEAKLAEAGSRGSIVINPVVYAEVAAACVSMEEADMLMTLSRFMREDIPYEAAFLAGRAYREYRRRGGAKGALLPDFLIGAHAVVQSLPLLTRDRAGYGTYFPELEIIAPDGAP